MAGFSSLPAFRGDLVRKMSSAEIAETIANLEAIVAVTEGNVQAHFNGLLKRFRAHQQIKLVHGGRAA